jgi:ubiquinone/menaquinone biosynthesis C-methylase UbiE
MKASFSFSRMIGLCLLLFIVVNEQAKSQNLDVPYVPTPDDVVAKMLELARVGPGDYVIDLGSGDGRIVIAAAKKGAVGHGIDLNPVRVKEAQQNAQKAGVTDRVLFLEGDLFKADISQASVITMYLLSSVNLELRPTLLKVLKPGTRIVSHAFNMADWEPDQHEMVDHRNVYYWTIPATVEGSWQWMTNGERFSMKVTQKFQKISIELTAGNTPLTVNESFLSGDRISFIATNPSNNNHYVFNGRVENNQITGTSHIRMTEAEQLETWSAKHRGR